MAKSADYLISGVWKNVHDIITHVMLHPVSDDDRVHMGSKTSESDSIRLLKQGKDIKTMTWNYPGWQLGAKVIRVTISGVEYLKTEANATKKDNLDNMISMEQIN